ncbi:hypothetical protein Metev_0615 [Methanohalobium evestigatum Z-7303]|uniref:Zona occludens toxin N-terminal domain-containing protein n=1 Tax=Methanohalobium evestigatum (strain ATCC BAA-1072 / DSM 3721 / NBRC 107634 / OCM 161 / Z-7303) TaxID=644295 RepID=D7E8H9_METEZ|nr:zonular occludens toxin domain-containing protein [Methanohalobium evestigatum]ADI73521.1 hypothetical protein Metev_0615 [Methanohalobium evestigatum Z-7303]
MHFTGTQQKKTPSPRQKGKNWYRKWLFQLHKEHLIRYLDERWEPEEHSTIISDFYEDPYLGYLVITDYLSNLEDPTKNFWKMINVIRKPGQDVILISGSKGSGKTYEGWRLLHALRKEYKVYWVGPPINLPEWAGYVATLDHLPQNAVGLVDESAIFMNSRRSMSKDNVESTELLAVARHQGRKVIFITQNTSRSDNSLTIWADVHIIKPYTSLYGKQTEREIVFDKRDQYFEPKNREWSYVKSTDLKYCTYKGYELDFYDEKIGTPFSVFENEDMAMQYAEAMAEQGYGAKSIQKVMRMKGMDKGQDFWQDIIDQINPGQ